MKKYFITRPKMLGFLEKLAAGPGEKSLTLYLPPRLSTPELENLIKETGAPPVVLAKLIEIITPSPNGAVIFWGEKQPCLVVPPFPIQNKTIFQSYDAAPLVSLISRDYLVGVVLIRLGSYGIGVFQGNKLVSSKVGTGLVHGRHRQGGSSSRRFERHRDKQMESFFNRVCGHIHEQFEPYAKSLDYLVYGGAWETIQLFIKYCPLLAKLNKPVLPPLSDTPEPRQAVLEKAIGRIWSSTVYDFSDD
jgi:peptide subunit release factor 1 (eRF1)